jgi:GMP synthase (glutamine-hydrolysing)
MMSKISTDLQDVEKIIVLDYGSQYNQLISRRIREYYPHGTGALR